MKHMKFGSGIIKSLGLPPDLGCQSQMKVYLVRDSRPKNGSCQPGGEERLHPGAQG